MVVQVAPAAARGDRAPPGVTLEDGVPMAGLCRPLGPDVAQEALATHPVPVGSVREGEDRRPEERHDRRGRGEGDLRIGQLPLGTRTRLPLVERRAGGWGCHWCQAVAAGERPLDLVTQAADRYLPGPAHPGGGSVFGDDG